MPGTSDKKPVASPAFANVVIPIPIDTPFSYSIPEELAEFVQPGVQVLVPFGERYTGGIVLEVFPEAPECDYAIKAIHDVVSPDPFVKPAMLQLLLWIAGYYICALGEAFRLVNPAINLKKSAMLVKRTANEPTADLSPAQQELWEQLDPDSWTSLEALEKILRRKGLLHRIYALRKRGLAETEYQPPEKKKVFKTEDMFALQDQTLWQENARAKYPGAANTRYARAQQMIAWLQEHGPCSRGELRRQGYDPALLRRLENELVLQKSTRKTLRQQQEGYVESSERPELTKEQLAFVERVSPALQGTYRTYLLHGITGSGKTEIYIELVRRAIALGKEAIVLIPEIVLTPQTRARFAAVFGDQVAVLHSRLSAAERIEILQRIREGGFQVVIGPRSAIFSPFQNIGIIIVDEEHEGSYKQHDGVPRYQARDVALYRGYLENIPVVLGSASPSFESLYNAKIEQRYDYFYLDSRVGARSLPRIRLIDLREEWRKSGTRPILSENLELQLEARLLVKQQAMLLQNRRGFSPYIQCADCGYLINCSHCDITLTYHSHGKMLRCHYCGHQEKAPDMCPDCRSLDILYQGVGTQMIEQATVEKFPHASVLRMDQDTTRRKGDFERILQKFRSGEADFLIGTRMIAKGLDFERVTLVGIVSADQGLQFPDFRAGEKVFQMLMQAAGRAGRGMLSGEVLIQTFDPTHYMFRFLLTHNYLDFFTRELETRKNLNYPPYSRLCLIRVTGPDESAVVQCAQELSRFLYSAKQDKKYSILGPAPAPLLRINDRYRYHILIKQARSSDPSMSFVRQLIRRNIYLNPEVKKWPVEIQIDMDPWEIL